MAFARLVGHTPRMHASATRPATSARTVTIAFYALCSLVLLALVTKAQKDFLPSVFATQLGHNSESFALALAVGVTIQFLRPRWSSGPSGGATRWGLVLAVAGVWLALALGVYYLGLHRPSRRSTSRWRPPRSSPSTSLQPGHGGSAGWSPCCSS